MKTKKINSKVVFLRLSPDDFRAIKRKTREYNKTTGADWSIQDFIRSLIWKDIAFEHMFDEERLNEE